MTSSQLGHGVEDEPRGEGEPGAEAHRNRQADDLAPLAAARSPALSFSRHSLDVGGVNRHDVPVQRTLRRGGHVGHELDRPGLERGPIIGMNSSDVPSWERSTAHSRRISSRSA